jgi:hypothetical protein
MPDAAQRLSASLDGLAAALAAADVAPERSARLLATAAAAILDAVTLEALAEERTSGRPPRRTRPRTRAAAALRLAA